MHNPADIIRCTAEFYHVTPADMTGNDRHRSKSFPRQVAYHLLRKHTRFSLESIGDIFGGRDHTTVYYGASKVQRLCETDAMTRSQVEAIEKDLGG